MHALQLCAWASGSIRTQATSPALRMHMLLWATVAAMRRCLTDSCMPAPLCLYDAAALRNDEPCGMIRIALLHALHYWR